MVDHLKHETEFRECLKSVKSVIGQFEVKYREYAGSDDFFEMAPDYREVFRRQIFELKNRLNHAELQVDKVIEEM